MLRTILLARRRALDAGLKARWDERIGQQLLTWWGLAQQPVLAVYWPLPGEPDLMRAYARLAANGAQLALPVVLAKDAALAFTHWLPGEAMTHDRMGVAVPSELRLVARPPAILIPCVGYNAARIRLGYGGGYYDRTLDAPPRPLTLGVAYACQQAQFDGAPHDVALDAILTEAN